MGRSLDCVVGCILSRPILSEPRGKWKLSLAGLPFVSFHGGVPEGHVLVFWRILGR